MGKCQRLEMSDTRIIYAHPGNYIRAGNGSTNHLEAPSVAAT